MDFVKKILEFFQDRIENDPSQFYSIAHFLEENRTEYTVTVHGSSDGCLVFCVFTNEEWAMVTDICELTSRDVQDVVAELANDNSIMNIVVDPRDMD